MKKSKKDSLKDYRIVALQNEVARLTAKVKELEELHEIDKQPPAGEYVAEIVGEIEKRVTRGGREMLGLRFKVPGYKRLVAYWRVAPRVDLQRGLEGIGIRVETSQTWTAPEELDGKKVKITLENDSYRDMEVRRVVKLEPVPSTFGRSKYDGLDSSSCTRTRSNY